MVVNQLDLGYLALFLGQRINELVLARARAAGFTELRESQGYVVQHLIESERSITELARRMEVSQQAASKAVAEMVTLGILETTTGGDRRSKMVRLSERGWQAVQFSRRSRKQIDKRLRGVLGTEKYEEARSTLLACLTALGSVQRIASRRVRPPQ